MPAPVFRHYEIVILLKPDLTEVARDAAKDRVKGIIEEAGGRIARWETWGKRRMAYEVKKQTKAIYLYCNFVTAQSVVHELERQLRIMESVLKYQTVRLSDEVLIDAFDFEAEGGRKTPLYMSPEDAAAAERSYQREADWATSGPRDGDDRGPRGRGRDDRGPGRDDRGPRGDDRGPRSDDRGPRSDDRGPRSDDRGPRSDDRGPRSDDRGPRSDDRSPSRDDRGPSRTEEG